MACSCHSGASADSPVITALVGQPIITALMRQTSHHCTGKASADDLATTATNNAALLSLDW
eukprot:1158096-Pelagomonas_calceolata.AAC.9